MNKEKSEDEVTTAAATDSPSTTCLIGSSPAKPHETRHSQLSSRPVDETDRATTEAKPTVPPTAYESVEGIFVNKCFCLKFICAQLVRELVNFDPKGGSGRWHPY